MVVFYRERGREILVGGGGCNFFLGVVILGVLWRRFYTGISNIFSGGVPPDPPLCITVYIMSFLVSSTTFEMVGRPQYLRGGQRGVAIFPMSQKEGLYFFFLKTRVQNPNPLIIDDRSHSDCSLITI